jgi:hypothetical protein
MCNKTRIFALVAVALLLAATGARGDAPSTAPSDPAALAQATADKALNYLKSQQKPDFSWQTEADPLGLTALVQRAFLSDDKYDADIPFLDKSFDKVLSYQGKDGVFDNNTGLVVYNTAIVISALGISQEAEYREAMFNAVAYLRTRQWSDKIQGVPDNLKVPESDPRYGGFGYGKRQRSDLSNTQMALDALHDAGVSAQDPAFQEALKFATRCQNFSETNDQPWAGNDGGFVYTPADGGISSAGEYVYGGRRMLRSYGSMTYAGLKSMIYAGVSHDDPRVKAAWGWISGNFTVDENPGMSASGPENAQGGLYYYFYTMARALNVYGQPIIVDPQGNKHDWRAELINKVATLQNADGSFVGKPKWMESNPVLVTAYTVIVLETAKNDLKQHPAN